MYKPCAVGRKYMKSMRRVLSNSLVCLLIRSHRSRAHGKEVFVYEMNASISYHFNPQCKGGRGVVEGGRRVIEELVKRGGEGSLSLQRDISDRMAEGKGDPSNAHCLFSFSLVLCFVSYNHCSRSPYNYAKKKFFFFT